MRTIAPSVREVGKFDRILQGWTVWNTGEEQTFYMVYCRRSG